MLLSTWTASILLPLLVILAITTNVFAWEPTWASLDSRPLPSWYDESKFGIFVHWGVFSVPSFGSEWFWKNWASNVTEYVDFVKATEVPGFAYQEYAHRFRALLYDAQQWAQLFADSGAQYVVLTSKHHEGFCNWDSRDIVTTWNWNAMDVGPRRDVLGELANATKSTVSPMTGKNLHWGVYHSLLEWFNPAFAEDASNDFNTSIFRDTKTMPELYDLVNKYEPELIWSDGFWGATDAYWNAPEFLAWYATNSSVAETAVWNDRWGDDVVGKHGSFITPSDRFNPGKLLARKWENALTIDATSWGYNRNATLDSYLSVEYFVHELIQVVAWGGNMLLNVGPSHDGTIDAIFWDRLLGIGSWLKVNRDAIYATTPWKVVQNETSVDAYYTRRDETLYALVTRWPTNNVLELVAPQTTAETKVTMLGHGQEHLQFTKKLGGGISIQVPALTPDMVPCQHAWVFAVTGVANLDAEVSSLDQILK